MKLSSKKTEILDFAQDVIQRRGYNGLVVLTSLKLLGFKSQYPSSLSSKEDLAIAVVRRYKDDFISSLMKIAIKARIFVIIYVDMQNCMKVYCTEINYVCGMLASDIETFLMCLEKKFGFLF